MKDENNEKEAGYGPIFFKKTIGSGAWAVVVAQLAERSLPIPMDPDSIQAIEHIYC